MNVNVFSKPVQPRTQQTPYFPDGTHEVEITSLKEVESNNGVEIKHLFFIEGKVINSTVPSAVGKIHSQCFNLARPLAHDDLRRFLAVCKGIDQDDASAVTAGVGPTDVTKEALDKLIGMRLGVDCSTSISKKTGNPFTRHRWERID